MLWSPLDNARSLPEESLILIPLLMCGHCGCKGIVSAKSTGLLSINTLCPGRLFLQGDIIPYLPAYIIIITIPIIMVKMGIVYMLVGMLALYIYQTCSVRSSSRVNHDQGRKSGNYYLDKTPQGTHPPKTDIQES